MGKYQELIERLHSPAWWDLENDCSLLEEAEAAVRKLEEYVDTGLKPDDVRRLQKDWTSLIMTISEMGGMPHLHEISVAEQEGRLVVLPCKVGASIFRLGVNEVLDYWQVEHAEVYEDEVVMVDDSDNFFTADDIGKTVFLTREETEAALARIYENHYDRAGDDAEEMNALNAELEQVKRERDAYMLCCKDLLNKGNCNECGDKDNCSYCPRPGETVRANCPLWSRPKNEDAALDGGGGDNHA